MSQDTYLVFTKFLWCKQISHVLLFVFRIPNGTSAELTNLLYGLLKRDAKDRLDFNTFFHHSFIRPPCLQATQPAEAPMAPPPPPAPVSVPVTVPSSAPVSNSSTPKNSVPSSVPGALPPSPVAAMCKYIYNCVIISQRMQCGHNVVPM